MQPPDERPAASNRSLDQVLLSSPSSLAAAQCCVAPPSSAACALLSKIMVLCYVVLCYPALGRVFCDQDWVEGVLVCQAKENAYDQSFFSYAADGHVCCWELDAEHNCDIFRVVVSAAVEGAGQLLGPVRGVQVVGWPAGDLLLAS